MVAPRTCRLLTLGCKVNQYETQYVKEALEASGYVEAAEGQPADLCIVNTCTVTAEGDSKSRYLVRKLHAQNPEADIVVMGCYASRDPDAVARLPGVRAVIADREKVLEELAPFGVVARPAGISRFDGHQRAFVKVQDGCLLDCSYCIIPHVRPSLRSRSPEDIAAEVARLLEEGYEEIVLTGIHLGHYGIDRNRGRPPSEWVRLPGLLRRLCEIPGDFRIRLSSLEAAEARDELVRVLHEEPKVCPHLHLCLQSGSDRILRAMKRRYTRRGFLERCQRIRDALDCPALTTDIIVGFPGETEEDFAQTLAVAREAGFAKIHVFPFSPRAGTPAARLMPRVGPEIVNQRRLALEALERETARAYRRSLVGRTLEVLVEGVDETRPGQVRGTSCRYVPVSFRGHLPALIRRRVPVRIIGEAESMLLGEPEPSVSALPGGMGRGVGGEGGLSNRRADAAPLIPARRPARLSLL